MAVKVGAGSGFTTDHKVTLLLERVERAENDLVNLDRQVAKLETQVFPPVRLRVSNDEAWTQGFNTGLAEARLEFASKFDSKAERWDTLKDVAKEKGRSGHFEAGNARTYRRAAMMLRGEL